MNRKWCAPGAVLIAGFPAGSPRIVGMTGASDGPTRVPDEGRVSGWGVLLSGALGRRVIQPSPALLGSVNGPANPAPACNAMTATGGPRLCPSRKPRPVDPAPRGL